MGKKVLYWFWVRIRNAVAIMADARISVVQHAHLTGPIVGREFPGRPNGH